MKNKKVQKDIIYRQDDKHIFIGNIDFFVLFMYCDFLSSKSCWAS